MTVANGCSKEEVLTNGHLDENLEEERESDDDESVEDLVEQSGSGSDEEQEENGEDEGQKSEVMGDAEYELTRDEPPSPSAHEWKLTLMKAEFSEDLREQIRKMKPYERDTNTGRVITTKSLRDLVQGFCSFLDSGTKVLPKVMKNLTRDIFARCDLLFEICRVLPDQLLKFRCDSISTWQNVFHFLKFIPDPRVTVIPRIFGVTNHPLKNHKKKKMIKIFQDAWIGFMRCTLPQSVLLVAIPYITENLLDKLDEPHKTADFFFKAFDRGDMFAILSLGAIFKLIVHHNFEYPNFYDHVYSLTKPSVLYLDQKEKFIALLDKFLSSTHIPNYVVAGFIKRLCRMLLLAPLDAQEPVLGLIRNLLTRHPNVATLIHRDVPETLDSDPFDDSAAKLSDCGAINSSLWEIRSLQKHWHQSVAKRASFVDKKLQQMESFVRFRCQDELFSNMMGKSFGSGEDILEEKYSRAQDGSDDEEPVAKKRAPNKGKFARKHQDNKVHAIPTNFTPPTGLLLPENSFNLVYEKFWSV